MDNKRTIDAMWDDSPIDMNNKNRQHNKEMLTVLHALIHNWEHEIVEFKQANNNFKQNEIGEYFSAISNEANLKGVQHGWLVFGVNNKTKEICNSNYRDTQGLQTLKHEISQNTTGNITFLDIYEVYDGGHRVVMFKIPAAVASIPTAWKRHWYGRDGESLVALSLAELDKIRSQVRFDWTARLIEESCIDYLDKDAISKAREGYKDRHNDELVTAEVDAMSDEEFVKKLRLMENGKLTYAAMILLGNPDYDNKLDRPVQIMWRLYDSKDMTSDYQEFRMPYILSVDKVLAKVRNLTYRYLPVRGSVQTVNISRYDTDLQKELLHNSIAHMDYTQGGRIYVDEFEDHMLIQNPGEFIPREILPILSPVYNAPYYRNPLLAAAMTKINMIDSIAMGIRKVFKIQQNRFFPMPDYFHIRPDSTSVKIYGKTLDMNYTYILHDHPEFDIETVYLLDQVQKKKPLSKEQYKHLRTLGTIEGRAPNVYVSPMIADIIDERVSYTKNKAMDDKYYIDMIVNYLKQWENGQKKDFIELLSNKLPEILSKTQKENKVKYYLKVLSQDNIIEFVRGTSRTGVWVLGKTDN